MVTNRAKHRILTISFFKPKLVNNKVKSEIIQIRILNLAGDHEQTFKCKWPNA